jgi:hypothetical protein
MNIARAACVSLALLATGCRNDIFTEHGSLRSHGNYHNTWDWHPQGCTRDPFDGLPVGQSKSIATLLWAHPGLRSLKWADVFWNPDAPLRLEFLPARDGEPGDVVATLHTAQYGGILLDKKVCSTLKLHTQEHPASYPGGRPTLSGELELDCHANDSHITGNIQFKRCEY